MKRAEQSAERVICDRRQVKSTITELYQDRPVSVKNWSLNSMVPKGGNTGEKKAIKGRFQTLTVPATANGLRGLL